jgi:hypothetical protein
VTSAGRGSAPARRGVGGSGPRPSATTAKKAPAPRPVPSPRTGTAPGRSTFDTWAERVVSGEQLSGPRGRLGVLWFFVAVVAATVGLVPLTVLFAVVAAVAGLQNAAAWRRARKRPVQVLAGLTGAALPLAAALGIALLGAVVLLATVAAVAAAMVTAGRPGGARRGRPRTLAVAGLTLRCGLFTGLAAASAVLVWRTDAVAFVVLLVLISAYEVGDYLVGSGANTPIEGPLAGIAAVMVLTFALSVFQLGPFDSQAAWVFGGLVAAAAPLGTFVGSTLAPSAAAGGPGLRRLDAWLIAGPLWAWMLWGYLG